MNDLIANANNVIPPYYVEELYIDPSKNCIINKDVSKDVQPKVMEVLTYLCCKAGQVISNDELIQACWPNQYISDGPLHKCIAQLRKVLADDTKSPRFIKTVPKKGYVFIAKVKGLNLAGELSPQLSAQQWTGESPYPGMQPYNFNQSELFFGREHVIAEINRWFTQITKSDTSWLSISATVGSGKTSLVYAGLLPLLTNHSFVSNHQPNFYCVFDLATLASTDKPHIQLISILLTDKILSNTFKVSEYEQLLSTAIENSNQPNSTPYEQAARLLAKINTPNEQSRFVLFVDHLEQLFDCYSSLTINKVNQQYFFTLLQMLVSSKKCLLITTISEQFLPELSNLVANFKTAFHYPLPAFSHTELIDIIEKPAALAGVNFEYNEQSRERLNSEIIKQIQAQFVPLSILQYLLEQLYSNKFSQQLTFQAYNDIGGISGCFAHIAEQLFQQFTPPEKACFNDILFRLITLNANGQVATNEQPCDIKMFSGKNTLSVLNQLLNRGVLQFVMINHQTCVCLAHSSLLTTWPRIEAWIKNNLSTLYVRHDLHIATQRWLYHQQSQHLLIHSRKKIKHLKRIIKDDSFTMTENEKSLIDQSAKKLTRNQWKKRGIISAFVLSFICLAGLSFSLVEKNNQINATRTNAENLISFILYDLKDKLEPLGKLELLNLVADKTLNYFKLAGTDNLTGTPLIQWVEALHILGEVSISKNKYDEAEAYFQQTLAALNHALAKAPTNEKLLELTMLANYWLGYSAYLQLDYEKTFPYWQNYRSFADTLFLHYPKNQWQLEQSYALNNLGALAEKVGDLTKAGNYFEQSANIKLTLLEVEPNNFVVRMELADTRSWQANINAKAGKLYLAINNLQHALRQVQEIDSANHNFKNIERMSELEHKIALFYFDAGNLIKAEKYANDASKNLQLLILNDEKNYRFKNDVLWNFTLLIEILINQRQLDQALIFIDKSKTLIEQLKNNLVMTDIIKANIDLMYSTARIMALLKQFQSAKIALTSAFELFTKQLSVNTETVLYAHIMLFKVQLISHEKKKNNILIKKELIALTTFLENKLHSTPLNFKILAVYLDTLTFIQQQQLDININVKLKGHWLQLYQQSDYNIPDYLMLNSQDK